MFVDGQEWKLVPVEPTPDWIANLSDKGLRIGKLESAIEDMLAAAPTPPAQDQGDDCDDVDAILRIVGLDPERCRTEGGALNVGRTRTLWEDVVSLAAQASGQAGPSDEQIIAAHDSVCGLKWPTTPRAREDRLKFARAILQRYGQAPAASPDFPHYEMAFICRVLEGDHPEKADLDTALGMARSVRVALLKERAAQAPAASVDQVQALREALRNSADALERLAFAIRAPNAHTPQLVELAIAMRAALVAAQAPRPCTCHPDDRPDGPCREKYAASECQAPAADGDALREAVKIAYGYLWHVNNEPGTPNQYAPERAAYKARIVLREQLTKDERGEGITVVRAAMQRTTGSEK